MVSSVVIEAFLQAFNWDRKSTGIVKLAKPVWYGSTAVGEVGLADESIISPFNITKSNHTVVL